MKESWEVDDGAHEFLSLFCYFTKGSGRAMFDLEELGSFMGLSQRKVLIILEGLRRVGDITYVAPKERGCKYRITLLRKINIDQDLQVHLIPKTVAS